MDSSPQVRLAAAKELMDASRFEDAANALRAVLHDHPDYLQANYELAIACYRAGAFDESVERFAAVCAINPEGLRSLEFYDAILALPDHDKALRVLGGLLPKLPGAIKMIEAFGRLLHKHAAAAGLPHGDIQVVGDSHAVSNFSAISRCRVEFVGPRTLHHMALQPIDLAKLGVPAGAKLVTVFGEIDCRSHMVEMAQRAGQSPLTVARRIAARFVRTLGRAMERHRVTVAAICSILPPPHAYPDNPAFPVVGSPEERRQMAQILNDELAASAEAVGIGFLDIRPAYLDPNGFLDPIKSDGLVHVNYSLTGPIEAALDDWFGPEPSA
jgi:tetratricopeptide (TPR) repeat protein